MDWQHTATLGLGSNLGDRSSHLEAAVAELSGLGEILRVSSIYATEPVDYLPQPEFLNQVVQLGTRCSPFHLLRACQQIEINLGRVRRIAKGPRTIDLDLLLFDGEIIDEIRQGRELIVPHPRLHERRFVLEPLAELMPGYIHPVLGRSVDELLATLRDPGRVTRIGPSPGMIAREQ
ncbi:MAG: 2-amino-4-hydroxy-6-hydroxymethyldihydropteridine diphosphokinase [Acidobacteria bacterium]|nr:2-amino-4-hydroxy-6-hydroxymethyldihydropteridine diphosphokinase [Acidobacteriota bacterium]